MAGRSTPIDGDGSAASFGAISVIRYDPTTGDLLVFDSFALRRVTMAGRVKTLLTKTQMCPYGWFNGPCANVGVDSAGSAVWLCLNGTLQPLTPAGAHTSVAATGLPSGAIEALNIGYDDAFYAGWSVASSPQTNPSTWLGGVSRIDRSGTKTPVWTTGRAGVDFSNLTDLAVPDAATALVVDYNASKHWRIDLVGGSYAAVPGLEAEVVMEQHFAVDGGGHYFTMCRRRSSTGQLVGTFPNFTSQFGIAELPPFGDVIEVNCASVTGGRACQLELYAATCR